MPFGIPLFATDSGGGSGLYATGAQYRGLNRAGAEYGDDWDGWTGQTFYTFPTSEELAAELNYLDEKGFNCIRLPISWERIQHTLNSALDTTYKNSVVSFVNQANSKRFTVVIDVHNYARYATGAFDGSGNQVGTYTQRTMGDGTLTFAHLQDLWVKLVQLFSTGNRKIIFALMNEPHDFAMTSTAWFSGVQGIINAIRGAGYNQLILVPNTRGSDIDHWNVYSPGDIVLGSGNGGPLDSVAALAITDSANNYAFDLHAYQETTAGQWNSDITNLTNWARTNGKKLFMSEMGIVEGTSGGSTLVGNLLTHFNSNNDVWLGWTNWNLPNHNLTLNTGGGTMSYTADGPSMAWYTPYLTPHTATRTSGGGGGGGGGGGDSFPSNPWVGYSTNTQINFTTGGVQSWLLVPDTYDSSHNTPINLFVWLHGCGGYSQYDVAYFSPKFGGFSNPGNLPATITQTWITLGVGGREGACWQWNVDQPKITDAIAYVKTRFNIAPKKIYIGGYSSGGDIGYPYAFANSNNIAGALFCNTDPFDASGGSNGYDTAPNKFNIAHLAHLSDTTYPIATVRSSMTTLEGAGYTVTKIELAGNHGDYPGGDGDPSLNGPSTNRDIYQYLLPKLNLGWSAP